MARILPCVLSLQQALAVGFTPDRLLCLRPPFSREFNRATLKEYRIDALVTKASGARAVSKKRCWPLATLGSRWS